MLRRADAGVPRQAAPGQRPLVEAGKRPGAIVARTISPDAGGRLVGVLKATGTVLRRQAAHPPTNNWNHPALCATPGSSRFQKNRRRKP